MLAQTIGRARAHPDHGGGAQDAVAIDQRPDEIVLSVGSPAIMAGAARGWDFVHDSAI
jgi:hypothetical protein